MFPYPAILPCAYCTTTRKKQALALDRLHCEGCNSVFYCNTECKTAHADTHASECPFIGENNKIFYAMYEQACVIFPQLDIVATVPTTGSVTCFGVDDRIIAPDGGYFRFPGGICSITTARDMLSEVCEIKELVVPASGRGLPACIFTLAAKLAFPWINIVASDIEPQSDIVPTIQHDLTQKPLQLKGKAVLISWMDEPAAKLPKPISLFVAEEALRERSPILMLCTTKPGLANAESTIAFINANFDRVWGGPSIKVVLHDLGFTPFGTYHTTTAVYKPKIDLSK